MLVIFSSVYYNFIKQGAKMKFFITNTIKLFPLLINLFAFILYGIDKFKAIHKMHRIPEKVLFLVSLTGGSIGALLGMIIFHHKTKHTNFIILNFLFLAAHLLIVFIVISSSK